MPPIQPRPRSPTIKNHSVRIRTWKRIYSSTVIRHPSTTNFRVIASFSIETTWKILLLISSSLSSTKFQYLPSRRTRESFISFIGQRSGISSVPQYVIQIFTKYLYPYYGCNYRRSGRKASIVIPSARRSASLGPQSALLLARPRVVFHDSAVPILPPGLADRSVFGEHVNPFFPRHYVFILYPLSFCSARLVLLVTAWPSNAFLSSTFHHP